MKAFALDGIVGMAAKRLTKRAIRDIVETVSGELPATFADDVLKRISAATYVTTFADRVAFTETLQRHREDFSSLLQHMADSYRALFADVGRKATLERYMELQLRWRQGLRKACECSFLRTTEDAQVEEDQEHPAFSTVSDDWASLLLYHDVDTGENLTGLAKHSLLIIFQHIGTAVWDFMQQSIIEKKAESGEHTDESQAMMSSEVVEVEEDAIMLFRVCGAQLHSMMELRHEKDDNKSKREMSAMELIRMPKEQQEGNLPYAIRAVERGGRVFPRISLIPFLQQINAKLVKMLEDCSQFGKKLFEELHTHLAIEDDYPAFITALQEEVLVDEFLTQDGTLFTVYQELLRKIVNSRKKEWMNAKKKILQLKEGQSSDVSLNLRDELKVYAAKKKKS